MTELTLTKQATCLHLLGDGKWFQVGKAQSTLGGKKKMYSLVENNQSHSGQCQWLLEIATLIFPFLQPR